MKKEIQLVKLDPAIEESLMKNPAFMEAMIADNWAGVAELVHELVGRVLTSTPVSVDSLAWDGYFVVDAATREVVGSCAFKGPPSDVGAVEMAYFTYPDFEGRGYATAMAGKLIELAGGSAAINCVLAHTLPHSNASARVLEKSGMEFAGEVTDPDDGQVWQWRRQLR